MIWPLKCYLRLPYQSVIHLGQMFLSLDLPQNQISTVQVLTPVVSSITAISTSVAKPCSVLNPASSQPSISSFAQSTTPVEPSTIQDSPLDLSISSNPHNQKTTSPILEIYCKEAKNIRKVIPLDPVYSPFSGSSTSTVTKSEHLAHDPRLLFPGAPSSYTSHALDPIIQSKTYLWKTHQQARYQRRLIPVWTTAIIKEQQCYLPDGSIMELRDIWKKDPTEE